MATKNYKTLDEQIEHIEKDKKVIIEDKEQFKEFLLDNNYYRFINSTKIDFCQSVDGTGKHSYQETDGMQWIKSFKKEWYVRERLLLRAIKLENKINSRVAFYLGALNDNGYLDRSDKGAIKTELNKIFLVNKQIFVPLDMKLEEVWKYVSNAELGIVEKVIKRINYRRQKYSSYYNKLSDPTESETDKMIFLDRACAKMLCGLSIDELVTFRFFRNSLVHQVPLQIFLTSYTLNSKPLQSRYDFIINRTNFKSKTLKKILLNSKKYVNMKSNKNIFIDYSKL